MDDDTNMFYKQASIKTVYDNLKLAYPIIKETKKYIENNEKLARQSPIGSPPRVLLCALFVMWVSEGVGLVLSFFITWHKTGSEPRDFDEYLSWWHLVLFGIIGLVLVIATIAFMRMIKKKRIEKNSIKIDEIINKASPYLKVLPKQFWNYLAVVTCMDLIEKGQADDQKELFDKCDKALYRLTMKTRTVYIVEE